MYNSVIITWCIKKRMNLVYMLDQNDQVMLQLPCSIFILINTVKKILQAFQKIELLFIFLLIRVLLMLKLFFEVPTQRGMMIDVTVRLVFVYMLLLRETFT